MHIDHSKLIELLTEATGLKEESVQKHLLDLVDEIKSAIQDGDAYEVDGFGVFSGIGNNIIFIPSDDLATEINYKYAGMEPLIMDEAEEEQPDITDQESSPAEVNSPSETAAEDDDPFGGLLDEADEEEADEEVSTSFELDVPEEQEDSDEHEEKPGPDQWGIETYRDEGDENMFSGLLGDANEEDDDDDDLEDDLSSIFGDDDTEDISEEDEDDLAAALSKQLSGEEDPDNLDSEDEDLLGAFIGDDDTSDEEEPEELIPDESLSEPEKDEPEEESLLDSLAGEVETEDKETKPVEDSEEEFDDPFEALAASGEDEEEEPETESEHEPIPDEEDSVEDEKTTGDQINDLLNKKEDDNEVIPVIKNLASDAVKKKESEPEEVEDEPAKAKKKSKKRETQTPPVLLWVVLIIILIGGGIYGLGYFNVIHIPGVSPETQIASTQQSGVATETQSSATESQTPQEGANETRTELPQESQTPEPEQPVQTEVPQSETVPAGQDTYGLRGVPVSDANSGYTIVVYSLSNENNARTKQRELSNNGYRALMVAVPSQQYGTLWRVSIGQFASQRNAALAAEQLDAPFSENYFITRIR